MKDNDVKKTTVGVLVVHGMGEQKPGSHRNAVAESLVRAWQEKYGRWNVREVRDSKQERACKDEQDAKDDREPKDKGKECVKIQISSANGDASLTEVEIREVFWADADESPQGSWQSIVFQIKFWCWGLSQWAVKRYSKGDTGLPGSKKMYEPVPKQESRIPLSVRLRLFGVGVTFALLGVTWELLRFLVRRLRIAMGGSGILVRSLGDVQLYTENRYRYRPADVVAFTDAPRDAIRRRMIKGLVDMALGPYHRWYVVAHSLGSVVAHNGLMELAEALPNYLTEDEWKKVKEHEHVGLTTDGPDVTDREMRPARPEWLKNTDAIDRRVLFERLKGFCTYGSPLDKFATLWPAIVPINTDHGPLSECEWINVHDLMDPVGARLDRFPPDNKKGFEPTNMPYRACILFALSHIAYLKRTRADSFAARLGDWIVTEAFDPNLSGKFGGGRLRRVGESLRRVGRYFWWFLLSGLAAFPWILLVATLCENCVQSGFHFLRDVVHSAARVVWHAKDPLAALCVLGVVVLIMFFMASVCSREQEP